MLKTIIFSLGSLIFTILLFAIYSYKAKTTKHENKYYRNLLLILCVVLITEIISAYTSCSTCIASQSVIILKIISSKS